MAASCAQEVGKSCDAPDHDWTALGASVDYGNVVVAAAAAALLAAEASYQMAMVVALVAHAVSG